MPINKYELRSMEVQEVMKSPPKHLIILATSTILVFLAIAAVFANYFNLPTKIVLPCKILKIDYLAIKHKWVLEFHIEAIIAKDIQVKQNALIMLDNLVSSNLGEFKGIISRVDTAVNIIECSVESDNSKMITTDSEKKAFLVEGMLGSIKIYTGSTSMMRLFLKQLFKKYNALKKPDIIDS